MYDNLGNLIGSDDSSDERRDSLVEVSKPFKPRQIKMLFQQFKEQMKYEMNNKDQICSKKVLKGKEEFEILQKYLQLLQEDDSHSVKLSLLNEKYRNESSKMKPEEEGVQTQIKEEFPSLVDKSEIAKSKRRQYDNDKQKMPDQSPFDWTVQVKNSKSKKGGKMSNVKILQRNTFTSDIPGDTELLKDI